MIRILIADADPAARKALSLLLLRRLCMQDDYEVADVESLIRTLANTPPEFLLLDWEKAYQKHRDIFFCIHLL